MAELTHINEQGRAKMVDVSEKADTKRIGIDLRTHLHAAGDLYPDHRWKNKKRRCTGSRTGSWNYGSKKNMGDHPNVPPVITDRRRHSF